MLLKPFPFESLKLQSFTLINLTAATEKMATEMMNNNNGTENQSGGDWELRPGGMLVQKRDVDHNNPAAAVAASCGGDDNGDDDASNGDLINITVSHGSSNHEVVVPSDFTFGALKIVIAEQMGLDPKHQQMLFRGKRMEDEEKLHVAGLRNMSKLILLEVQASKEVEPNDTKASEEIMRACNAIAVVRAEVDKHSEKVGVLAGAVYGGTKVVEKDFLLLTELLMRELLKLDGIDAEGEAKMQRKMEVRRIQSLVETLDNLKARNLNPSINNGNKVASVTTDWETFDSGVGSLTAPPPPVSPSCNVAQDWQRFD